MQTLFEHQKKSVSLFDSLPRAMDTSDPGTGKTRVQIEVFASRRSKGEGAALVIAPKSLLKSAWEDDFKKFAPQLRISIASAINRTEAFKQRADVYVTNTDAAKWLAQQKPPFFNGFDTLIIDEISAFKHRTSARSKALNKIKRYFKYRYGLTGTPRANTITDLWHPYFIIDDGKRLGASFWAFRSEVCTPQQVGPLPTMVKWLDKPGSDLAVASLLSDVTVRHKLEECLDIPENYLYTVQYHMEPKQLAKYKDMERDAITLVDRTTVTAVNAAVVMGKLLQIASGSVYTDEFEKAVKKIAGISNGRASMVCDLIEERQNSLVFFSWTHQRDALIEELNSRGLTWCLIDSSVTDKKRNEAVTHFQSGFYKVMLAHPQSAAHGLTLTRGTSTIWASPTHNLEHFLQGNRRIYRAGQTEKTETVVVIAANTIEQIIYDKMLAKDAKQTRLLEVFQDVTNETTV
jgi:SNF2 family DNA or RNA helicase